MDGTRTMIIAEAGVNHNGDLELAKELVRVAARCGVDAVKFQTFRAHNLVSGTAPKAEYQARTTDAAESQLEMIRRLELGVNAHRELIGLSRELGIRFMSAPFDLGSVDLLARDFDLPVIKIPSGEITNALLLLRVALSGKLVILSTGMSTLEEIEAALGVLAYGYLKPALPPGRDAFAKSFAECCGGTMLKERVTLLHCTTEYPAPFDEVNLRAMDTLRDAFGLGVGLSDHTPGIAVPIAAVARGAAVIEKHFTLDRDLPGPDHKASLDPGELSNMVQAIRQVELALGKPDKGPTASELKNISVARKSLVAATAIRQGEPFSEANLCAKRPGGGLTPFAYWDLIGTAAPRAFHKDEPVAP